MEDLIQKTCTIWKPEWQGILIGRIYYWWLPNDQKGIQPEEISIEWKENRLIAITCRKKSGERVVAELKTLMLHPSGKKESRENPIPLNGSIWRNFSKEEVWSFSRKTGDQNLIHLSEKPIVQGFLLLEHLTATFPNREKYQISFHSPVLADENIYLQIQGESFYGYGNKELHFTGTAEKRRNEE